MWLATSTRVIDRGKFKVHRSRTRQGVGGTGYPGYSRGKRPARDPARSILTYDAPQFLSDRDERSLPSIIQEIFVQSNVKPRIRWPKLNRFHALSELMTKILI